MQEFTGSKILLSTPVFKLHKFNEGSGTPIFLSPPHAGRHSNIVQPFVNACVREGKPTYAVELLSATHATRNTSIIDLVNMLNCCIDEIGEPVDLACMCQGAWLGAIYTSRNQEKVLSYANFAGPINTKTGQDNIIEDYCKTASMEDHRTLVKLSGGIQPGIMQWLSFSFVSPAETYFGRWLRLGNLMLAGNWAGVEKEMRNNSWHDETKDLAGVQYLDCLENHFIKNKLYDGTWEVGGKVVDLSKIVCPVFLYGGEDDEITHPQQVSDMGKKVSGPVFQHVFQNAGHTAVFTRKENIAKFLSDLEYEKQNA